LKDDRLYLIHISECIARIQSYTADGKEAFLTDTRTQDAVMRNLQVLAESAMRLSAELKTAHADLDWKGMAGFRNILVHDYLGINLPRVWEIVAQHVPALKAKVEGIRQEIERGTGKPGSP
jgi:uncharacterized protein with HEPN domain